MFLPRASLITYSLFLLVAAGLASCSGYEEVELKDITHVEVLRLTGSQVALRVDALVSNPNGFKIQVEDPDVDLYLNDRFVGKGMLDSTLVLERKATRVYPVYLRADLQGGSTMLMLLGGALSGQIKLGAKGTVAGRSGMLKKRFPFELEETIDLRSAR
jgi:LEA14-like dessication related protein